MSRQLGFVLGVAILVAVLGSVDAGGDPVAPFHAAWTFMVIAALCGAHGGARDRAGERAGARGGAEPAT